MTRLLVSVTDAAEAIVARDNGADLIDVKDPSQGSLGAQSPAVWREVIAAVGKKVQVSAALGELNGDVDRDRVNQLAEQTNGLAFAKIGLQGSLPGEEWRAKWMLWRSYLPMRVRPVMVVYADWRECGAPHPQHLLDVVKQIRIPAVLVDTFDKQGGSLREHCSDEQLIRFCAAVRKRKSLVVLAGSLQLSDLPAILPLQPDFVAVRGAVCREARTGSIDGALVREWSQALSTARR